jgi:hypothetical protein
MSESESAVKRLPPSEPIEIGVVSEKVCVDKFGYIIVASYDSSPILKTPLLLTSLSTNKRKRAQQLKRREAAWRFSVPL